VLEKLALIQFRNHPKLHWEPAAGWNILIGPNGRGKTSLLEACYYLGRLKSFRTGQTRELVQWDTEGFRLEGKMTESELAIKWSRGQRSCFLNGQATTTLEEFWGQLSVVCLSSEDSATLVEGPNSNRLQWLDSMIAQEDISYLSKVQRYNGVLRQRNAWLRSGALERKLGETLTQQLLDQGKAIALARSTLHRHLQPRWQLLVNQTMPGKEIHLALILEPLAEQASSAAIADKLPQEQKIGRTLFGVHRDQLQLTQQGKPLARYGSEGEIRMAALLLRLLEAERLYEIRGRWPLLLLDDVLTPLDVTRKNSWLQKIPANAQCFLTTTEASSPFTVQGEVTRWQMQDSTLERL
jgi:DNA replication and repair protein RecF